MNFLLLMLLLVAFSSLTAQEAEKIKTNYSTLAVFQEDNRKEKGYLLALEDSSLLFSRKRILEGPFAYDVHTWHIQINEVNMIKFKNKNGPLIGAGIGALVGGIVGSILLTKEPEIEEYQSSSFNPLGSIVHAMDSAVTAMDQAGKNMASVSISTLIGAGIGALIGSASRSFQIGGKQEAYARHKEDMKKYVMK